MSGIEDHPAPMGHNQPPVIGRYARTCPECSARFRTDSTRKTFCDAAHKKAFHIRAANRGQTVTTLLQAWRAARNFKTPRALKNPTPQGAAIYAARLRQAEKAQAIASEAFGQICRKIDQWNAEDRAAGRLDALKVVERQFALGLRD